jgi:hypothetical protein
MRDLLEVGALVRLPSRPEWGVGQVQSLLGEVATVNFEHAGKVVIKLTEATLTLERTDWL